MADMDVALSGGLCDLELSATLKNVARFRDHLRQYWEEKNLPHGVLNGLLLVVTEFCNNACEYSDPAPSRFLLSCRKTDQGLDVIIRDDGQSFDPHDGAHPNFWNDVDDDAPQFQHMGAGCYLVLHYFPDLEYVPAGDSTSGLNEIRFQVIFE